MDLPSLGQRLFGGKKLSDNKGKSSGAQDLNAITKSFLDRKGHSPQKVAWQLEIQAMYTDINPQEILLRTAYGDFSQNVWVPVKLSEYPKILNCASGTQIKVSGLIHSVKASDIYLENCKLEFIG